MVQIYLHAAHAPVQPPTAAVLSSQWLANMWLVNMWLQQQTNKHVHNVNVHVKTFIPTHNKLEP
jgi:hypothetical protein